MRFSSVCEGILFLCNMKQFPQHLLLSKVRSRGGSCHLAFACTRWIVYPLRYAIQSDGRRVFLSATDVRQMAADGHLICVETIYI